MLWEEATLIAAVGGYRFLKHTHFEDAGIDHMSRRGVPASFAKLGKALAYEFRLYAYSEWSTWRRHAGLFWPPLLEEVQRLVDAELQLRH